MNCKSRTSRPDFANGLIADMSKRSVVDENTLISKLNELIKTHKGK